MASGQLWRQAHHKWRVFSSHLGWVLALSLSTDMLAAADSELKPFAEAQVLLQVSDNNAATYTSVLDISNNLIKHYGGPDLVDIEIIAFGKGVEMYFDETGAEIPNQIRIRSLQENGVRFYVCMNTLDSLERASGKRRTILPNIVGVQTGVAFIVDEANEGFTVIKP